MSDNVVTSLGQGCSLMTQWSYVATGSFVCGLLMRAMRAIFPRVCNYFPMGGNGLCQKLEESS